MADMPVSAPKMPLFDPSTIIRGITEKVVLNKLQLYAVIGIGFLVVGVILYLIWMEYQKHPIKHKSMKWGKSMKLSDILRKK